jgi:hypothetical protein
VYQRAHLPERAAVAEARAALAATDAALASNDQAQQRLMARFAELERATNDLDARKARLEAQLRTIVVPREAETLQRQIAGLVAEHGVADEEGIGVLDEMEALAAAADDLGATRAAQREALDAATSMLAAAEADVDARLEEARGERGEAVGLVPAALVARYESMRPSFAGVAVARLEGSMCTGCHLTLSRVEFEAVRADLEGGRPAECPQCARLLVRT